MLVAGVVVEHAFIRKNVIVSLHVVTSLLTLWLTPLPLPIPPLLVSGWTETALLAATSPPATKTSTTGPSNLALPTLVP